MPLFYFDSTLFPWPSTAQHLNIIIVSPSCFFVFNIFFWWPHPQSIDLALAVLLSRDKVLPLAHNWAAETPLPSKDSSVFYSLLVLRQSQPWGYLLCVYLNRPQVPWIILVLILWLFLSLWTPSSVFKMENQCMLKKCFVKKVLTLVEI